MPLSKSKKRKLSDKDLFVVTMNRIVRDNDYGFWQPCTYCSIPSEMLDEGVYLKDLIREKILLRAYGQEEEEDGDNYNEVSITKSRRIIRASHSEIGISVACFYDYIDISPPFRCFGEMFDSLDPEERKWLMEQI